MTGSKFLQQKLRATGMLEPPDLDYICAWGLYLLAHLQQSDVIKKGLGLTLDFRPMLPML